MLSCLSQYHNSTCLLLLCFSRLNSCEQEAHITWFVAELYLRLHTWCKSLLRSRPFGLTRVYIKKNLVLQTLLRLFSCSETSNSLFLALLFRQNRHNGTARQPVSMPCVLIGVSQSWIHRSISQVSDQGPDKIKSHRISWWRKIWFRKIAYYSDRSWISEGVFLPQYMPVSVTSSSDFLINLFITLKSAG